VNYADKSVEQPGEDPWGKQVDEWARSVENDMSKMAPRLQLKEPLPECEVDGLSSDSRALEQRDTDELSASTAVLSLLERPQAAHHQEEGFNAKLLQMTLSELSPSLGRGKLPTLSDKSDGCGEANTEDDELDDGASAFLNAALSYVRDNPMSPATAAALKDQMSQNSNLHAGLEDHQPLQPVHQLAHQKIHSTIPSTSPTIVIDGANVARHHNRLESGFMNIAPIHTVLDYWLSQGHQCIALLPDFWFTPARQARRKSYQPSVMLLNMLQEMGLVAPIPEEQVIQASKLKLDPPLIQYSKQHHGVIVTTDTFADALRAKPDKESREYLRAWIRVFTMPFNFVGATYVPQPDYEMPSQSMHLLLSVRGSDPAAMSSSANDAQLHGDTNSSGSFDFEQDEFPSVAAFRRHAMLDVMKDICSVEHKDRVKMTNEKRQNRFLTRKVAADVFNKWVFQTHATGSSANPLMSPSDREGWTQTHTPLDPVIPSCENSMLKRYIERQLVSGYEVTEEAATVAAAQLSAKCLDAAQRVYSFTQTQKRWWSKHVSGHEAPITDQSLGMAITNPSLNKSLAKSMVQITWKGSGDQQHEHCQLWKDHFEALEMNYLRGGHNPAQMLSRIFVMVLRYETLSEVKSAYQAALPKEVLQVMQEYFGVRCECFASPLNCYCDHFCSLFPDTDAYFGSRGSFFDYAPTLGSFECNPPFDQMSVLNTFGHIFKLLRESEDRLQPLSFIVTTAQMDFNANFSHFQHDWNRFCTKCVQVPKVSHSYLMGLQHRQTGESRYWSPSRDSALYFLQNQAGAAMWPATDEKIQLILDAWKSVDAPANHIESQR